MRAKQVSLLVLVIMMISLLTGCTLSDEQKAIKKEVESVAKPYIESFVKEKYSGWEIRNINCLIVTTDKSNLQASEFARAYITNKEYDEDIEIVYNTKTDETYIKDGNIEIKDKIAKGFGIKDEFIVDVTFELKELQKYDLNTFNISNYMKKDSINDERDYKINIVANCEKKKDLEEIKEYIKNKAEIKVDYEIILVQGYKENTLGNVKEYIKIEDNCSLPLVKERCNVIVFKQTDGIKSVNTTEFKKLAIDGGYIIYNGTNLSLKVSKKDSKLGIEESMDSKVDTEITVSKKDKSVKNTDISIFSDTKTHAVIEDTDGVKSITKLVGWEIKIQLLGTNKLRVLEYVSNLDTDYKITVALINKEE